MRIAIAASLLKAISAETTGGTEIYSHILAEGLVQKGVNTTLFATSDSITSAKLISICSSKQTQGVYEGNVEIRMPYQLLQSANIVKMQNDFDIIHNNYFGFFAMTAFSPFTTIPIVTTMVNHFFHYPNLTDILVKTHRKDKDIVVFLSQAAKDQVGDKVTSQVIYPGIDISKFPFSASPQNHVLWLSRMIPAKGIKDAIDAARKGNFELIAAGGGALIPDDIEYIKTHVEPYFSETIKYVGSPSEEEKISLYQNAKALLFPTHLEEQFGLVAAEAMACGTPVIAYNHGAVSEVVKDGVTGFIIDPDDEDRRGKGSWIIKKQGVEGLVEAVGRIGEIDRKACHEHVEKHFTRGRMIEEYVALYEKMIKR